MKFSMIHFFPTNRKSLNSLWIVSSKSWNSCNVGILYHQIMAIYCRNKWHGQKSTIQLHARLETTWQTVDVSNAKRTLTVEMEPLLVLVVPMESFQPQDRHQKMTANMVTCQPSEAWGRAFIPTTLMPKLGFTSFKVYFVTSETTFSFSPMLGWRLHDRKWMSTMWRKHLQWRWCLFLY